MFKKKTKNEKSLIACEKIMGMEKDLNNAHLKEMSEYLKSIYEQRKEDAIESKVITISLDDFDKACVNTCANVKELSAIQKIKKNLFKNN